MLIIDKYSFRPEIMNMRNHGFQVSKSSICLSSFPVESFGRFRVAGSATAKEGRDANCGEGPTEAKGQSQQRTTGHGQSGRLGGVDMETGHVGKRGTTWIYYSSRCSWTWKMVGKWLDNFKVSLQFTICNGNCLFSDLLGRCYVCLLLPLIMWYRWYSLASFKMHAGFWLVSRGGSDCPVTRAKTNHIFRYSSQLVELWSQITRRILQGLTGQITFVDFFQSRCWACNHTRIP